MPHLKPSQYSMEIVGEKSYQKAIKKIVMFKEIVTRDDLEYKDDSLIARLVLEDDNRFDPGNAVRVDIEGETVGYLAREDAQAYRQALVRLGIPNEICSCNATAIGRREDFGKPMGFGIWLSIEINRLEIGDAAPRRKKLFGLF